MSALDLWAPEAEPTVRRLYATYRLTVPSEVASGHRTEDIPFVYLDVYSEDGLATLNLHYTLWFNKKPSRGVDIVQDEIWEWLQEWELVESKRIGPEDSEFFVTDKFWEKSGKEFPNV